MEIAKKIKTARIKVELTQEHVADELQVSRQTISNWENAKTYPDIISIIKLSDLYQISLDELLKGDDKMIEHLNESPLCPFVIMRVTSTYFPVPIERESDFVQLLPVTGYVFFCGNGRMLSGLNRILFCR